MVDDTERGASVEKKVASKCPPVALVGETFVTSKRLTLAPDSKTCIIARARASGLAQAPWSALAAVGRGASGEKDMN